MASESESVELVRLLVPSPEVDWAAVIRDDTMAHGLQDATQQLFEPGFRCGLIGVTETWRSGFEGLREIWIEWLEPWDTYRIQEERIDDLGDGRVLWLGRDIATRAGGAGEIVLVSSAMWTVKDGMVTETVFYSDREQALREAGLAS